MIFADGDGQPSANSTNIDNAQPSDSSPLTTRSQLAQDPIVEGQSNALPSSSRLPAGESLVNGQFEEPDAYPPAAHTKKPARPRHTAAGSSAQPTSISLEPDVASAPTRPPPQVHSQTPTDDLPPPRYESLSERMSDLISPEDIERRRRRQRERRARRAQRAREVSDQTATNSTSHTLVDRRRGAWVEPPPAFGIKSQVVTVPEYLFYYGFIFPPLWGIGSLVLIMKLNPVPEDAGGAPAQEQAEALGIFRETEIKWATRCLIALITFVVVVGAAITAALLATR